MGLSPCFVASLNFNVIHHQLHDGYLLAEDVRDAIELIDYILDLF